MADSWEYVGPAEECGADSWKYAGQAGKFGGDFWGYSFPGFEYSFDSSADLV